MTSVIAFDVNETLLDLRALDPHFAALFGSSAVRAEWFVQMLQLAFVGGLTSDYVDFTTAQKAALRMLGERHGIAMNDAQVVEVVDRMRTLPAHPEVVGALESLAGTSLRLVALTNSPVAVADAQLTNAGLHGFFEAALSGDTVRALKPAAAAYRHVAEQCDVKLAEVRLVAAHAWDVSGALVAGARAAFVARPGMVLSPLGAAPDIVGRDLTEVAELIIERDLGSASRS
ncbi:MAG TPA: haloacid dehalogenase type II [Solirubrobacteraceae bacterium]|nr:haloacid dehalogenase type II [Solirubrobacteraceae bacterium]